MATRINRSNTAATKMGGGDEKRDTTDRSFKRSESMASARNRRVFKAHEHENVAKHRNASTGIVTRKTAPGVPASVGYTPRRGAVRKKDLAAPKPHPAGRKKLRPSGRGISGGEIYVVGTHVKESGKTDAGREKPRLVKPKRLKPKHRHVSRYRAK